MSRKVTKAIITAAGYGTRFLPATKNVPKEMLPIVDRPILQYLVDECVEAGITDIIIVTRYGNDAVENYFDSSPELEIFLEERGKKDKAEMIRKIYTSANFIFVRQSRDLPYGNGSPILVAKNLIGKGEPFAVLWGDDLIHSKVPGIKQLMDAYRKSNCDAVISAQRVPKEDVCRYGIVQFKKGTKRLLERYIEKPPVEETPSRLAIFGRYILTPKIYKYLKPDALGKDDELWLADAVDKLAQNGKVLVHELKGKWMTTGDPLRYLKATIEYALRRKDINGEFVDYLKEVAKRYK